jgi:hypothetical protein
MADPAAANGAPEGSPESRLYSAGFTRRLEFWCPPGEERALSLDAAIALLDAGEIKPYQFSWPGVHPDAVVGFRAPSEEEMDRRLGRAPQSEPPPLPEWAAPWAELVADKLLEKMKPVIRAEVRAALRAEARRQAREQAT